MTLVSWWLTSSARNSKENLGREAAEWQRGRNNRQFSANKSPVAVSRKRCKIGLKLLLVKYLLYGEQWNFVFSVYISTEYHTETWRYAIILPYYIAASVSVIRYTMHGSRLLLILYLLHQTQCCNIISQIYMYARVRRVCAYRPSFDFCSFLIHVLHNFR